MKRLTFIFIVVAAVSISVLKARDEKDKTVENFLQEWTASLQTGNVDQMAGLY